MTLNILQTLFWIFSGMFLISLWINKADMKVSLKMAFHLSTLAFVLFVLACGIYEDLSKHFSFNKELTTHVATIQVRSLS